MITLSLPTNSKQITPFDRSAFTGYQPSKRAARRKRKQAQPFSSPRSKKPRKLKPRPARTRAMKTTTATETKEVVVRREAVAYRDDNYAGDVNLLGIDIPPGWVGVRRELRSWQQPSGYLNRHERREATSQMQASPKIIQFPMAARRRSLSRIAHGTAFNWLWWQMNLWGFLSAIAESYEQERKKVA